MCCDSCDLWIHVSCDLYFTEEEYDYLVQNPSSDPWFCSTCTDRVSDSLQSHFETPAFVSCDVCILMLVVFIVSVLI